MQSKPNSMSSGQVHIKCLNCGAFNIDTDICTECGAMLNVVKQRELVRHNNEKQRIAIELAKEPSAIDKFLKRMMSHPWILIRLFFQLIYGVWFVVMTIAMFIAWLIGFIAA